MSSQDINLIALKDNGLNRLKRLLPMETISGELISAYCFVLSGIYILINSAIINGFLIVNPISVFAVLFSIGILHVFAILFEPPTHILRILCLSIELLLWMIVSILIGGIASIVFSSIGLMIAWSLLIQVILKEQISNDRDT